MRKRYAVVTVSIASRLLFLFARIPPALTDLSFLMRSTRNIFVRSMIKRHYDDVHQSKISVFDDCRWSVGELRGRIRHQYGKRNVELVTFHSLRDLKQWLCTTSFDLRCLIESWIAILGCVVKAIESYFLSTFPKPLPYSSRAISCSSKYCLIISNTSWPS